MIFNLNTLNNTQKYKKGNHWCQNKNEIKLNTYIKEVNKYKTKIKKKILTGWIMVTVK